MELNIFEEQKLVGFWLNQSESCNNVLQDPLQFLYAHFKTQNYRVAVFRSGERSLLDSTTDLILHNQSLCARSDLTSKESPLMS